MVRYFKNGSRMASHEITTADGYTLGHFASAASATDREHVKLAVVANSRQAYEHLRRHVTSFAIKGFLDDLPISGVKRFELPRVLAFNLILYDALVGPARNAIRLGGDAKLVATRILEMPIPALQNAIVAP